MLLPNGWHVLLNLPDCARSKARCLYQHKEDDGSEQLGTRGDRVNSCQVNMGM